MSNYSVSVVDADAGADPQTLINLFSIGGNSRAKVYDILISSGATPADQAANIEVMRTTAVGTEGSGYVPVKLDPDGPTSNFDSGVSHSAEPTETALSRMLAFSLNQRATFRWVAAPGSEIILPATTNNGINLVRRTSTAAYVIDAVILFNE